MKEERYLNLLKNLKYSQLEEILINEIALNGKDTSEKQRITACKKILDKNYKSSRPVLYYLGKYKDYQAIIPYHAYFMVLLRNKWNIEHPYDNTGSYPNISAIADGFNNTNIVKCFGGSEILPLITKLKLQKNCAFIINSEKNANLIEDKEFNNYINPDYLNEIFKCLGVTKKDTIKFHMFYGITLKPIFITINNDDDRIGLILPFKRCEETEEKYIEQFIKATEKNEEE